MDKKQKGATNGDSKKWIIPLFPSGWRHAVGNKIFNHMIAWRTDATKGRTEEQLSEKFDLKVERFDKTKSKTNKRKAEPSSQRRKSKNPRKSKSLTMTNLITLRRDLGSALQNLGIFLQSATHDIKLI